MKSSYKALVLFAIAIYLILVKYFFLNQCQSNSKIQFQFSIVNILGMATRIKIKEMVIATIEFIHKHSKDMARKLYEKHEDIGILSTTLITIIMCFCGFFTICLFSVSSLCAILFIICTLSVALFSGVAFIAFHMLCISLLNSLNLLKAVTVEEKQ